MKRDEQKIERRKQILMVALDLFVTKGFAATKISDIAKGCGMSTGLLFHYFNSKEALYLELVNAGVSRSKEGLNYFSGSAINIFEQIAKQLLNEIENNCFVAKMFIFMAQASNNDFLSEETRYHLKWDNIRNTEKIILLGQREGTIKDGDETALAVAFWAAIQGVCQTVIMDEKMPCPDYRWIVDIIKNT